MGQAAGAVQVAVRLVAFVLVLLVSVALYYAWRLLPIANPWPRRFLGVCAWLAGARRQIVGIPAARPAVFLANHVSWLDVLLLAGATGAAFVAHSGLAGHPVLKWLCDMNKTVFITRDTRGSVARQVAQVRDALHRDGALAIFPEATTSDGTGLLPFKSSLLSALEPPPRAAVVQPVWLDYGEDSAAIAWFGNEPGLANLFRILSRRGPMPVTLHFLAPLDPAAIGSRKLLSAAARESIEQAMIRARSPAAWPS